VNPFYILQLDGISFINSFVYWVQTEKEVIQILTQVAVTKREQEIKLDEADFDEKKKINKRKGLIMQGLEPEEADRIIEADIEWKRRGSQKKKSGKYQKKKKARTDSGVDQAEASTSVGVESD
jgi:ATP-dependent RNA helicase DDX49/DBP8